MSLIKIANKFEQKIKQAQTMTPGAEVNQLLTTLNQKINNLLAVNKWIKQLTSLEDLQAMQRMINENSLKTSEDINRYIALLDKDVKLIGELPKYI